MTRTSSHPRRSRFLIAATATLAVALIAACSGDGTEETTTTTTIATTTTTAPPGTSSTTTTAPPANVTVSGSVPADLIEAVTALFDALDGGELADPGVPDIVPELARLMETRTARTGPIAMSAAAWDMPDGTLVAAAQSGPPPGSATGARGNVVLLVADPPDNVEWEISATTTTLPDDPDREWRVVGARLPSYGLDPLWGDPDRRILAIGSDARFGQDRAATRADSIHIMTAVAGAGRGAIVGIPRDSWVPGPSGSTKITNILATHGPDLFVETVEEVTGLDMDGYLLTGFTGFVGIVENFGGLTIDLEDPIRSGEPHQPDYPAGEQMIDGDRTLWLARIRKTLSNGDFGRSENQGLIMLAALQQAKAQGMLQIPWHVRNLLVHVDTDLSPGDLATLLATALELSPDRIDNVVVPGRVGTVGEASVVFIGDGADAVFRDLEDGVLEQD